MKQRVTTLAWSDGSGSEVTDRSVRKLHDTMRLCEYVVSTYMATAFPDAAITAEDRRVVVQFMKCQLFGVWIDWVSGGMKEESLADLRRMLQLCRGVPELIVAHSSQQGA